MFRFNCVHCGRFADAIEADVAATAASAKIFVI